MRILYVCHRFPYPPIRGGKIRPFNVIQHLSRRHEVTVCSLARSPSEAADAQGIAPYCARYFVHEVNDWIQAARMIALLPTSTPSSVGYFYSATLARRVRALLANERFDLVFVHCSSVARYVPDRDATPRLLDFGDMDSQKWLDYTRFKPFPVRLGYALEALKMRAEEIRLANRFDMCTATTRAELETLRSYDPNSPTDWFPNGVDTGYFAPAGDAHEQWTIAFVGRMDYFPNQECMFGFCRDVMPLLRARYPKLELLIVGAAPSDAVRRLGEQPGVTVTGSVADVRPYLRRSALMVAPLNIARGTQNKILEAMALGVPVVTSRLAAGGVDALEDEHFLVGSTPAEYAAAITRIIDRPDERRRLARAGRARVESHHSWEHSMQRVDRIIDDCRERPRVRGGSGTGSSSMLNLNRLG